MIVFYVAFVITSPVVTSFINSWAVDLIRRVPSPLFDNLQLLASEHFSQAVIALYSLWITRDLLRRSSKVKGNILSVAMNC